MMLIEKIMYCGWQVIVVIFLEAANAYTPNKVFFI